MAGKVVSGSRITPSMRKNRQKQTKDANRSPQGECSKEAAFTIAEDQDQKKQPRASRADAAVTTPAPSPGDIRVFHRHSPQDERSQTHTWMSRRPSRRPRTARPRRRSLPAIQWAPPSRLSLSCTGALGFRFHEICRTDDADR